MSYITRNLYLVKEKAVHMFCVPSDLIIFLPRIFDQISEFENIFAVKSKKNFGHFYDFKYKFRGCIFAKINKLFFLVIL